VRSHARKNSGSNSRLTHGGKEVTGMAKDGTNRGGRRVRAGDKPQALADKIAAGKAAKILEPADLRPEALLEPDDLTDAADLTGADMPAPSEYLSTHQKDGRPLGADALYAETWNWLRARGCEKFVNPRLIEAYAQAFARFIQCEEAISTYGLLGKHPTTGGAITSPFVVVPEAGEPPLVRDFRHCEAELHHRLCGQSPGRYDGGPAVREERSLINNGSETRTKGPKDW
jgi:hypothetical protein